LNSLRALFRYPLDVNVKNTAGFTALYYAIKKNDNSCMETLLEHGADPNFVDEDGNTLLHIAAQSDAFFGATQLARYKLNPNQLNRHNLTPLHIAILKNFRGTASEIIWRANANLNTPLAGESPLIFAIRNELVWLIEELVGKGADVEVKDAMGNSAIDLALTRVNNTSIMYQLLSHGVKPDIKDANGNTPLSRALINSDLDAARTLIEYQVNPNTPDANGVMPIFHILRLNGMTCAIRFVEHGADLHVRDAEGNTPLHHAVQFEYVVNLMLQHGARVDAVNIYGDTPLHCIESMTPRSGYVLRNYGADINAKNNEGLTPYEKAKRYCWRGGSLDGRLVLILKPEKSHSLLDWYSGEQPKTPLASAEDYGIDLVGLPGLPDTQSSSVVPGQDPRIERLDDDDGQAAAAATQAPEAPGRAQEPQQSDPVLAGNVCTCWQIGTKLWERAAAYIYPWAGNAEQSHDSTQPASSPATVPSEELAPLIDTDQPDSTRSFLNFDDSHTTQSSDTTSTPRHRFFASSQP